MSLIRKVWAALVAFFSTSGNSRMPPAESVEDTETFCTPAPVAEKVQPLDHNETLVMPSPHGSPLKALLDQMERVFPAPVIKPGAELDDLQYRAGQRAVVEWVKMQQRRGKA